MKKNILICLVMSLFVLACEVTEPEEHWTGVAGVAVTAGSKFTSIDQVIIKVKADPSVSELNVYEVVNKARVSKGKVSLSSGEGTFTTTIANLTLVKGKTTMVFEVEKSAYISTDEVEVEIIAPTEFTHPKNDIVQDGKSNYIVFEPAPKNATVASMTVESKVGVNGAYAAVAGPWNVKKDSLEIIGDNFNPMDTVFVKVTTTSSDGVVGTSMSSAPIGYYAYAESVSDITLKPTNNVDLIKAQVDGANNDVSVVSALEDVRLKAGTDIDFVFFGTEDGIFKNADKFRSKNLYTAGTKITETQKLFEGDVIIFKKVVKETGKPDVDVYGMIKVTHIHLSRTDATKNVIIFDYVYM